VAIAECLRDTAPSVRLAAVETLGALGEVASPFKPEIQTVRVLRGV
jgi:hypothetical protein